MHTAANAHIARGEILDALVPGADEHHATAVTGSRLEPVHRGPVGAEVGERHPSGGGLLGVERRGPTPERRDGAHPEGPDQPAVAAYTGDTSTVPL